MGRRRPKSRSKGAQGPIVDGKVDDSRSTEAPALGPIVAGMQNASISTEAPILMEDTDRADVEPKSSIYREDSVLSEGDYWKAVKKALESLEKRANVAGECGLPWSSQLRRLLLSRNNPPLELWWAFAAAEKHVELENNAGNSLQAASVMDFISKLLVSLSALGAGNASGLLMIAALAPVVALLHEVASTLHKSVISPKGNETVSDSADVKGTRKLLRKLKKLIKETLCYTVICRRRDFPEFRHLSTMPSVEQSRRLKLTRSFYPPFPLASKHMNKALSRDPLNSAVIAEVVSAELVMLQLIAETVDWRSRLKKQSKEPSGELDEFAEKIKSLARHSVFNGSTLSISGMLLDTLLEKRLPVGNLLDDTEEKLVRECIIENVLVDPPSFGLLQKATEKGVDLPSVLFMKKLAVGRRAIQTSRSQGDRKRWDALSKRISSWQTPPQLMKWLQAQKKHLLPVTALLGSQAFLSWVACTVDDVAFTSIFDRCVKAFLANVPSREANGESQDDDLGLEGGGGEDLFFVDTAGDATDENNRDAAADSAFTTAAKNISKGKAEGKEQGPIYRRLPQGGTGSEKKRGKKIIDELEEERSDSEGEDSTMVEDDSGAEDPSWAEDSSSDDEAGDGLVPKEAESMKVENKDASGIPKEFLVKIGTEKDLVTKMVTSPTMKEDGTVTPEKVAIVEEVPDVPLDVGLLPKKEVLGGKDGGTEIELDPERTVEGEPVLAAWPGENLHTGDKIGEVRSESSGAQTSQESPLVEKTTEVPEDGSIREAQVTAVPVLITAPPSKADTSCLIREDEVMAESAEVATTGKPFSRKKIKSRRNEELFGGKDRMTLESVESPATEAVTEQPTTDPLVSPGIASSCKVAGKSKRDTDEIGGMEPETKERVTPDVAITTEEDVEMEEAPPAVLVTSVTSKDTENTHMEAVDGVTSAPSGPAEEVLEAPASVPVTPSETSPKSKHSKEMDTVTVHSVPSAPPVTTTPIGQLAAVQIRKATNVNDTQTVDSVPFSASVTVDETPKEQEATTPSSRLDLIETSSRSNRGKGALEKNEETVQNVVFPSSAVVEEDPGTQDATPANVSDGTPSRRKRSKLSAVTLQTEAMENLQSQLPVISEDSDMRVAPPLSPLIIPYEETLSKSKKGKRASAGKVLETLENIVSPGSVASDKDVGTQGLGSPAVPVSSDDTPTGRKRGKKVRAKKNQDQEGNIDSESPEKEDDTETHGALTCKLLDLNETSSMTEGGNTVPADKEPEVLNGIPSCALNHPETTEQLSSQAAVEMDQKPVMDTPFIESTSAEQVAMTFGERDLEAMANVPSSASPTSKKKRGRRPKPRDSDGTIVPPLPPTRRIATRGTTPHIVVEKEEEKVDEEDLVPIILVTPHKTPRKSRRKVTVQELGENVHEVAEVSNRAAAMEAGDVPASIPVHATPSRGRKRTKVISDDDRELSPTPSVHATPSRGRKNTKAKTIMDDEVSPTPTSSVQAASRRGRKSTRSTKVVTDDETDNTQTTAVQAAPRRGRKAKVATDDGTDTTSTPSMQATTSRGEKDVETKVLQDDVDFDEISSPTGRDSQGTGKKGSKSAEVQASGQMPPSATKTPRKKNSGPPQPPEEAGEIKDKSGAVADFTPRRSKRGAGASQVVGAAVDMARSPYRSSKKRKTKLALGTREDE